MTYEFQALIKSDLRPAWFLNMWSVIRCDNTLKLRCLMVNCKFQNLLDGPQAAGPGTPWAAKNQYVHTWIEGNNKRFEWSASSHKFPRHQWEASLHCAPKLLCREMYGSMAALFCNQSQWFTVSENHHVYWKLWVMCTMRELEVTRYRWKLSL